jgi:hypothetical protein
MAPSGSRGSWLGPGEPSGQRHWAQGRAVLVSRDVKHPALEAYGRHKILRRGRESAGMKRYETKRLPVAPDDIAPDGSAVRILLQVDRGGLVS